MSFKMSLKDRISLHLNHRDYVTNFFALYGIKELYVDSKIFRPEISPLTISICNYLFNNRSLYANKKVLDLGCGCGIFSVQMAKFARKVIATDNSEEAIINTIKNAEISSLYNIEPRRSDLFDSLIDERFDLIMSNFPNVSNGENDGYIYTSKETYFRFINSIPDYLKNEGVVLLGYFEPFESNYFNPTIIGKDRLLFKNIMRKKLGIGIINILCGKINNVVA